MGDPVPGRAAEDEAAIGRERPGDTSDVVAVATVLQRLVLWSLGAFAAAFLLWGGGPRPGLVALAGWSLVCFPGRRGARVTARALVLSDHWGRTTTVPLADLRNVRVRHINFVDGPKPGPVVVEWVHQGRRASTELAAAGICARRQPSLRAERSRSWA
jgi:hypothetical protein